MQNYVYDRNYSRYNRMNRYRYGARYSSVSRVFRSVRRVLAAILLLLVGALVSEKAITVYKGVGGCAAVVLFLGIVGGVEAGSVPLALGFMFAFSVLGFVICKLLGRGIDL